MSTQTRRMALLAALGVAAIPAAPAAARPIHVSVAHSLYPAFKPSIPDYVSRCGRRHRMTIRVRPASRSTASVNGGRPRARRFVAKLRVRTGQQAVIVSRGRHRVKRFHVRCLPPHFPRWRAGRDGRTATAFYLVSPETTHFVTMFDPNGVPVWWLRTGTVPFDAKLLPGGHVAWARYYPGEEIGENENGAYLEHTLTGRRVRTIRVHGSPTDFHDMERMPNGDSLVISYRLRRGTVDLRPYGGPQGAKVLDGVVQQLSPKGRVKWQWSSKGHISPAEQGWPVDGPRTLADGTEAYDLVHLNSVEPHGGRLLISTRATDAIYDIDRHTKRVVWKLGGTRTPEQLAVIGDPHPGVHLFGAQHDARVLPDGTIGLHDNGTGAGRPPRIPRFRIDERQRTATLVKSLSDPLVPESFFAGSARYLPGGHWVAGWGGTPTSSELTASGKVVFRLGLVGRYAYSYRTFPVPRGTLSRQRLRRAMDVQYGRPRR